jgi:sugar phosphate isomerase/epimerase
MHDRISVNAICFPSAGFRDLAAHWRELGARRVSLVSYLLLEEGLAAAQQALRTGDCQVETIAHPFLPPGKHLDAAEESWREPRDTLSRLIEHAQALGARSIYLLTGGHGTLTWEEAAEVFRAAVAPCVAQARTAGIPLMIENAPPLYAHTHIAHTLRDAVTLGQIADVGVCIEFFACWTEAGLKESIERAVPRCHVVQVCDYIYGDRSLPSRAVPGDGAIPVKRMLEWILRAGYRGVFDLELIGPRIDKEGQLKAVRRAADNVGEMLQSLGA